MGSKKSVQPLVQDVASNNSPEAAEIQLPYGANHLCSDPEGFIRSCCSDSGGVSDNLPFIPSGEVRPDAASAGRRSNGAKAAERYPQALIAFGGRMYSGKSTLALEIADQIRRAGGRRAIVLSFASAVRQVAHTLGLDSSNRETLQLIGIELRRGIGADIWINALMPRIRSAKTEVEAILIDDLRFRNEAKALILQGFFLVHVTAPGAVRLGRAVLQKESFSSLETWREQQNHKSESEADLIKYDLELQNCACTPLETSAKRVLEAWRKWTQSNNV